MAQKTKQALILAALFAGGLACSLVPFVSGLQKTEDQVPADWSVQARAWNESLAAASLLEPDWKPEAGAFLGTLEIPALDLSMGIFYGTDGDIMSRGAGVVEGTSLPYGGSSSHSVLSAHNGPSRSALFARLDQIKTGDAILLHTGSETLHYRVFSIQTTTPDNADAIAMEAGRDLLSLVTCTPYGINSHRLVVTAERVLPQDYEPASYRFPTEDLAAPAAYLGVWAAGLAIYKFKNRKEKT